MNANEQAKKLNKIIATAWLDKGFMDRLIADPKAVLKEEGVEVPPGVEVRVAADTDKLRYLPLPLRPPLSELSDEQLTQVKGGLTCGGCSPSWYQCHWCDH